MCNKSSKCQPHGHFQKNHNVILIIEKLKLLIKISLSRVFLQVFRLGLLTDYESDMRVLLIFIFWQKREKAFCQEKTIPLEMSREEDIWGSINSNQGRKRWLKWNLPHFISSLISPQSFQPSQRRSFAMHLPELQANLLGQAEGQCEKQQSTEEKSELDGNYKLSTREWQFMPATSIILPTFVPVDQSNYKTISVKLANCVKTREYWKLSVPWLTVANKMDPVNTLSVISGALELHSASLRISAVKDKTLFVCHSAAAASQQRCRAL